MKNKKFIVAILLLLVIVLALSWVASQKRYNLQLATRFAVPGVTLNPNHKVLDGYAVSIALSDSLIYITDASDTTNTKSFCFDYSGKPNSGFNFPSDRGYGEIFVDKNLYFLPQSNMLAYIYWQNKQIDYYSTDGTLIRSEIPFEDHNVGVFNIVEYNHSTYFTTMSDSNTYPKTSMSVMQLFQEQSGQAPVLIKHVEIRKDTFNKHFSFRHLMIDDNGKDSMILLENQNDIPHATMYQPDSTIEFDIKTPKVFGLYFAGKLPFQLDRGLGKEPYQLVLGQDFLIIGSWLPRREYPIIQRIYNLKGQYLGKLKFKDDPQNELIDIIDDRLVAFNPAKGVVSIYKINVK